MEAGGDGHILAYDGPGMVGQALVARACRIVEKLPFPDLWQQPVFIRLTECYVAKCEDAREIPRLVSTAGP
jgi:hypothetical protein